MRSLHIMITTSLLAGGLIACGDDGPKVCTGHGDCDDAFKLPEGGEIRMELNGFADGTSNINIQALFFKSQNPPRRELTGTVITDGCEDWSAGNIFDNGDTPEAQAIADSREYIDIGNSLTVLRGNKRFVLNKKTNTEDRTNFLTHDIVYLEETLYADKVPNAQLRQQIDVGAEYEVSGLPFTLKAGVDPLGNQLQTSNIYIPQDWATISPTSQPTDPNITVAAGQDMAWTWDTAAASAPPSLLFMAFIDPSGKATHQCISEDTGSFTIPASFIDRVPSAGYIIHGKFAHHAYDFDAGQDDENLRRLDLLAINCHFFTFVKQ